MSAQTPVGSCPNRGCEIALAVMREIRAHARSSMDAEICGVLLGSADDDTTEVTALIRGEHAAHGGAHVTFTHETWKHIYKVKDEKYPDHKIVGWYHSHPGFGIFLSGHDLFIHQHFFGHPHQVAWVYDPHADEEGCFGWEDGRVVRLPKFNVLSPTVDKVPSEPPQEPSGLDHRLASINSTTPNKTRKRKSVAVVTFAAAIAFTLGVAAGRLL